VDLSLNQFPLEKPSCPKFSVGHPVSFFWIPAYAGMTRKDPLFEKQNLEIGFWTTLLLNHSTFLMFHVSRFTVLYSTKRGGNIPVL
jgi:hypothetical protein